MAKDSFKTRGNRFASTRKRFAPPREPRAIFPQLGRALGFGMKEPPVPGSVEWYCIENQQEFLGGTVSMTECMFYWAMEKMLGPEGREWDYQGSKLGGRHMPGGAVVDFVYYGFGEQQVAIRIQTYYFHQGVDPNKKAEDREQRIALEDAGYIVIDVWEQEFIHDETGQAVLKVAHDAINGIQHENPMASGLATPV